MKSQRKKIMSVNLGPAMFSLLDFLTLENGTDRLSWNISKEFPFYCVVSQDSWYLTRWFGEAGLGLDPHDPVHRDLVWSFIYEFKEDLTNLSTKYKGKILILHSSKYGIKTAQI